MANFVSLNLTTGLSNVNHVDGERVVTITADAIGRSAAEVLAESKRRLEDYGTREGYAISFSGQNEEQRSSQQFLIRALMIAVILIFFVLVVKFNSITLPFVIMVTVVLSFIGVFVGLLITFKPFSIIMTGIGVISLAGVVVNNAIVLIDYIQKLRARNVEKMQAIIQAGKTRLRPVLLTAITTILGLLPLTIGVTIDFIGLFTGDIGNFIQFGAESSQFWSGMGVVVIFGLAFATFLTLLVVPILYYILSDFLSDIAGKLGFRRKSES
jgi:multidrug efflux pump subunit AcrB